MTKLFISVILFISSVICIVKSDWKYQESGTVVCKYEKLKHANSYKVLTVRVSIAGNEKNSSCSDISTI